MARGGMGGRGRYSHGTTDDQLIARLNREANRALEYRTTKQIIRNTTPKETKTVTLENYEPVAERIKRFYEDHPTGAIHTELVFDDGKRVVMKASVWRDINDSQPAGSDYAEEVLTDRGVNSTSRLENCATSAQGRALQAIGYLGSDWTKKPTREEMTKVYNKPTVVNNVVRTDDAGNVLPLQIKGKQHGPIPQWALDAAAEQGIVLAYDNRDTLAANPKRPWFKCVESGAPLWAPKGTPLPTFEPEYDLSPEEPF